MCALLNSNGRPWSDPLLAQTNTIYQIFDDGEFVSYPVGRAYNGGAVSLAWHFTHRSANSIPLDLATLQATLRDNHPLKEILASGDPLSLNFQAQVLVEPEGIPFKFWGTSCAAMLGNSCHPLFPYLANGVQSAVADAACLVRELKAYEFELEDLEKAITKYARHRSAVTKNVTYLEAQRSRILHLPHKSNYFAQKLRNLMVQANPAIARLDGASFEKSTYYV